MICPTGFSNDELDLICEYVEKSDNGVMYAPTLTSGINILLGLVEELSQYEEYSFEIIERHSKNKVKPTKTSQYIADAINRRDTEILSVRLDGYVGIHEVTATNGDERLTIIHESLNRNAFVKGALRAARQINGKKGFFTIRDFYSENERE